MRPRPFLLVAVLFVIQSEAVAEDPDLKKLQGTWIVVSLNDDGKEVPKRPTGTLRMTFKGKALTGTIDGRVHQQATIRIDSTKTPKHFDTILPNGKTDEGVYLLNRDELVLFMRSDKKGRPTKTEHAKGVFAFTMKREPKQKSERVD